MERQWQLTVSKSLGGKSENRESGGGNLHFERKCILDNLLSDCRGLGLKESYRLW